MRKHGQACNGKRTSTYRSWQAMKDRCDNALRKGRRGYGAEGISYCKKWRKFENFLLDMGTRPLKSTLDRLNNDKNYSPANCRWATFTQQARNKRGTLWIRYKGRKRSLISVAEELRLNINTLRSRKLKGYRGKELLSKSSLLTLSRRRRENKWQTKKLKQYRQKK